MVHTLQERASQQHRLTIPEVAALGLLAKNEDHFIRVRALTALSLLGGTPEATAAADIARAATSDKEPLVRMYAVSALTELGAPDRVQIAEKLTHDPEEEVRSAARAALRNK
jgi:HEAT repeat protein